MYPTGFVVFEVQQRAGRRHRSTQCPSVSAQGSTTIQHPRHHHQLLPATPQLGYLLYRYEMVRSGEHRRQLYRFRNKLPDGRLLSWSRLLHWHHAGRNVQIRNLQQFLLHQVQVWMRRAVSQLFGQLDGNGQYFRGIDILQLRRHWLLRESRARHQLFISGKAAAVWFSGG